MLKVDRFNYIKNGVKASNWTRKQLAGMEKGDALLPVILLETAVTGGRTYHAYQRGGFIEGRERLTEETVGAIFWLGGVTAFNKLGDLLGKQIFGVDTVDFETVNDSIRKPFQNYLEYLKTNGKKVVKHGVDVAKYGEKALAAFKFTKVFSSILLANAVVGFVVPKINQAITRKYQESIKNLENEKAEMLQQNVTMKDYKTKIVENKNKKEVKNEKDTSFKGSGVQSLLTISNYFENDARYKLMSTDVGIAGGRAINARNKYERRESLFRDLSSIYFYLFCRKHLNSLLNLVQDGRSTRLDTVSTKLLDGHLSRHLRRTNKTYSAEQFKSEVMGDMDKVPQSVLKGEIFNNGIISLEDFEKFAKNDSDVIKRARKMSELQPKQLEKAILTQEQVVDVYKNGLIDSPELLKQVFFKFTKGNSTNPMKYFSETELRKLKQRMVDYVEDIAKKAVKSGENISLETLKRANRQNLYKNVFNLSAGFAVSGYFLSTAIPKIQYWITEIGTGKNKFPGIEKYDK